ncbi:MAG: hypothetical protein JSS00_11365, partial [Proteobacteria bacterium]|nr:hypothetical protein [Pseudomonadota bacterium]
MKLLRKSPLAIAAAALVAAPAAADPIALTPPHVVTPPQPAQSHPPAQPSQHPQTQPPPPRATAAQAAPVAVSGPIDLRGASSPLPQDLSPTLALSPPAAPPSPSPSPSPSPVATPAAAQTAAAAPPAAPARIAPTPTATVTAGVQPEYTRLVFRFNAGDANVTPELSGNRLDLRFSRAADIDLSDLRTSPPHLMRDVRRVGGASSPLRLQITVDPGVQQRHFTDGDRVVVDLLPPTSAEAAAGAPVPSRAPVSGTAHVQLVEEAADTQVTVTWPAPARAAAFRRGEAIWVLFDATGRIDL